MSTRLEAVQNYRRWRDELIDEAREDQQAGRPLKAGKKRHFARVLFRAIVSEEINPTPEGLGVFTEPVE